jgi:formate dehydrogenase subunit gamma
MAKSDHVTPAAEPPTEIEAIAQAHGNRPENLIEMLHAVQHRFGYVSDQAVHRLAVAVNRSRAEVHGVLTFYHDFRRETPGRHIIKICRAEACQAMGCRSLVRHAERALGIAMGETTADGSVTLEPVYCLGNCALSPAMMIDGALHGRVSPGRFDELVDILALERVQ